VDYDYLNRRMTEERQRAADAENEIAREVHLALAEEFRRQIEQLNGADEGPELKTAEG
jgi:hypothetical protein